MSDADELFDLRNAFYTGNYPQCIKEAQRMKPSNSEVSTIRDVYLYRSYLGQKKFALVEEEIGDGNERVKPIKMLAKYLKSPSSCSSLVSSLEQDASTGNLDASNPTLLVCVATILYSENNFEAAMRVLHSSDDLECFALKIQTLLKMDRVDLARKELKSMQEKDDDATLTQLATAWVNLQMGGDKIQDAYYIYQEMIDKFGSTPLLLNGQASSFLQQGKFEEAEAALQEAIEKDSANPDTLINMIVLAQLTGKAPEVCNRYLTQLKHDSPGHPFVKAYQQKESDFDRMVKQYAVSA
jgi:coatomer protein complex subunit epsilon